MEEVDKAYLMIRMGSSGYVFLVPAHLGSPRQRVVKRLYVCSLCTKFCKAPYNTGPSKDEAVAWMVCALIRPWLNLLNPHDAMLVQVLALALCLSQVSVLSKRMNESSWFLAWELFYTYPALC